MLMTYEDLLKRAVEVRKKYDELNAKRGVVWNEQNLMSGFVGDVGDLVKLVMAKDGKRRGNDIDAKLKHELGDCLWSLLVIANHYGINLEDAFSSTMSELNERLVS